MNDSGVRLVAQAKERDTNRWFWWYSDGSIKYDDKSDSRYIAVITIWTDLRDFPDYHNKERFMDIKIFERQNI